MSSQEGSEASSYDSEHYGDVARAGFVRMYALMHSALPPPDLNRDYRGETEAKEHESGHKYDNLNAQFDADDERDGVRKFQLLYANGRHYFHGEIAMPDELNDDDSLSQEKRGHYDRHESDSDGDDRSPRDEHDHVSYGRPPRRGDLAGSINVEDLSVLLPHFQQVQDGLTAIDSVTDFRQELRDVIYQMEEVGEFMVEELSKDKLIDRIDRGAREFHWMVSPENPTFFELQTFHRTNESFQDAGVVVIVMKIVVRGVLLDVIYHNDSYYVTLRENSEELALEDTFVPTLSCVGPCFVVRRYSDTDLKQLLLWCSFPPQPTLFLEGKSVSPTKKAAAEQQQLVLPAQTPSKVLKVVPAASSAPPSVLDANDTQLYCVLPTSNRKQQRKTSTKKRRHHHGEEDEDDAIDESIDHSVQVVFQFNRYVYHGSAQLRLAALNDLEKLSSSVLPSLKTQALESLAFFGSLADTSDPTELPPSIAWTLHVKQRFASIAAVLVDLVAESQVWVEKFLSEIDAVAKETVSSERSGGWLGTHLRAWLDNSEGTEFFYEVELSVSPLLLWGTRDTDEESDVELLLWKGVVHQVVVVVVYRRGSFFLVLRELRDVEALPDDGGLAFFGLLPSLEGKGRGYLVRSFPAQVPRRSHQWLSGAKLLLWQTVASVAREDMDAEDAQIKWLQSPAKRDEDKATAAWFEDEAKDEAVVVRGAEAVEDEAKAAHREKERVGTRHHVAPLRGARPLAGKPAPWDLRTGRPV